MSAELVIAIRAVALMCNRCWCLPFRPITQDEAVRMTEAVIDAKQRGMPDIQIELVASAAGDADEFIREVSRR
jgi:hypothetical protein